MLVVESLAGVPPVELTGAWGRWMVLAESEREYKLVMADLDLPEPEPMTEPEARAFDAWLQVCFGWRPGGDR